MPAIHNPVAIDLAVIFGAILVLVSVANRLRIAYPILLVLGGIGLGYIPGLPPLAMPPNVVLFIFLPPLLYWESVTAPTSEFFTSEGAFWIFQLAFGLVVITTFAVGGVAHALIPTMAWGTSLVLGAIVSSTDEVAFAPITERVSIPRHVLATIEGESLVNDATSLVLYGIAVTAVATGSFSIPQAIANLAISIAGAVVIGILVGLLAVLAWHLTKDDALQGVISLMLPFLSYFPATHFGFSGVLAVIATGFTTIHFTPRVLTPAARERVSGFWVTIVFMLNAFIFVLVGMQFHHIVSSLHRLSPWTLAFYACAISLTVIVVRLIWVFAQGLLPATNEPEHSEGKADWSHVAVLAWSGMRGGISLAAALAIPIETASGPFPERNLIIFLTFCVLLATLVLQGGTLPLLLRWMKVRDDGQDVREQRIALAHTAKAALRRLDELAKQERIPHSLLDALRARFVVRWREYSETEGTTRIAEESAMYRRLLREMVEAQREAIIQLRSKGKVDNTVLRRIQRLLDLEDEELDLIESTGHSSVDTKEM